MIDKKAFYSLSYGLYIIASEAQGVQAGCICNTFQQVTSSPLQASIALNKENATTSVVRSAGRFTACSLAKNASMKLIKNFGFRTSKAFDKFANCKNAVDEAGIPYIAEQACARFSVRVVQELDLGTHVLFVGEVEEAETLQNCDPMTYAFYHQVKGGKTPPKASSFLPDILVEAPTTTKTPSGFAWRCTVCGHIEYVDNLPDDFVCPVCGASRSAFVWVAVDSFAP